MYVFLCLIRSKYVVYGFVYGNVKGVTTRERELAALRAVSCSCLTLIVACMRRHGARVLEA